MYDFCVKAFALAVLLPLCAGAQKEESAAGQLVEVLGRTESMRAEVEQLTLDQNGREIQEARAQLVMRKPDHFYWRTSEPFEEVLTTDGETLWIYEPDLEQVTVRPFSGDLSRTPALLLSEDESTLEESFEISLAPLSDEARRFTLTPRDPGSLFETLSLTFSGDTLEQMHFEDSLGQKTSIAFEKVEANVEVDEDLFAFEPPAGVEVIDSTGP